jgi:hypothetical protein
MAAELKNLEPRKATRRGGGPPPRAPDVDAGASDRGAGRRSIYQPWHWVDETRHELRQIVARQRDSEGETLVVSARVRAITRARTSAAPWAARLGGIRWMMPVESGYYRPIVAARRSQLSDRL